MNPGDVIGAYRLEAPLGSSQIGVTWRAVHGQLESHVRLLVVQLPPKLRAAIQEMFARRVLPLSNFQATQLDRLIDSGVTPDGTPYFVTELLSGERLNERIARDGQLPVPDALAFGVELFAGLEVMHEAKMAHGRIAPERAFLLQSQSIDGPVTWLRLLDVGLSYVLQLPAQVEADPRYLAPELNAGQGPSLPGDVFAAGRLVQFMVGTGTATSAVTDLIRACTDPDPAKRPTATAARTRLAAERDADLSEGPEMASLIVQAVPASGDEGWLGEWDAQPAPKPSPKAPAASAAPRQSADGTLGGWSAPKTPPTPGAGSPALLYGFAALAALAIIAFVVRAVMIAPSSTPVEFATEAGVAALVADAARDVAPDAGDDGIDPAKGVKVFVSPSGARFVQVESGRVLCEDAAKCMVPINADTRIEMDEFEPTVLTGDDLYDRRGGKWIVRLQPKKPEEKPEPRRRRRRKRR